MRWSPGVFALGLSLASLPLLAEPPRCAEGVDCETPPTLSAAKPEPTPAPVDRYADLAERYRLQGTASYYSGFFEGRETASGEIFHHDLNTAAHLTLPIGTLVEVKSIATGRKMTVRINDRGPYSGGFVIDLTRSCAKFLGVDVARDRRVTLKVLALPGDRLQAVQANAAGAP